MIVKIKKNDLILFQLLMNPISASEILFHDFDSLGMFDKNKFGKIRPYQYNMLSYDSLFCEDKKLSKEKNWEIKNNLAESYNIGGRLTGKSIISIVVDTLLTTFNKVYKWAVISSYDKLHVQEVFEKLINAFENHKILRILNCHSLRSPTYKLNFNTGSLLESVNMNIASKSPGCFDEETEILTQTGWKYFKDLTDKDKVMSYNLKNKIGFYSKINRIIKEKYIGTMKVLNSRTAKFVVTPNHNFLMLENDKYVFKTLENNIYKQIYIPSTFEWNRKKKKNIIFSGIVNGNFKILKISLSAWSAFVAWYLAEGSLYKSKGHYCITLYQKNNCKELEQCLNDLQIHYNKRQRKIEKGYDYRINNKLIYLHLLKYFNKTKNKHVALYFKNYSKELLNIFIDNYLLADGHYRKRKNKYEEKTIFTVVKPLADDLQEIAQKAGYKTHLREQIQNTTFKLNSKIYIINLGKSKFTVFKREEIKEIDYNGYVYCVEVPNHTILVRRNGCVIWSGNSQFFGKHTDRHTMEESSYLTKEVSSKMLMAQSEKGCINRFSGMTIFTKTSPLGEIFFNLQNKKKIINLPSYVNPTWNDKKDADAIKEFGGRDSVGYQVQIEGKVIEGAESVFDIQRIRQTYIVDKKGIGIPIKSFEVNKDSFFRYKEIVIVEKPINSESLGIYADVGEGAAPSEYMIISQTNKIYKYIYRITTFQLSPEEEKEFIKHLISILQPNIIGLDSTSGVGKSLISALSKDYPDNIIPVCFNENIDIDYEKDNNGNFLTDKNGQYIFKQANVVDWSMQCLKDIFYNKKIQCYEDIKFDTQINNVIVNKTKQGKTLYGYKTVNHLFQSAQVFSICHWLTEFKNIKPIQSKKLSLGIYN